MACETLRMRNLKKLLADRDKTQVWLAHTLGVGEVTVSRWVIGQRHPDRRTLQRVASVLQCEIEEITGEINILTVEERQALAAFRKIPLNKRRAFWEVVNALREDAGPSPDGIAVTTSTSPPLSKPDKKPVDKA